MTALIFDSLTPKTPNPRCQEKFGPIHRDEPVLISPMASENDMSGGISISMWTWSSIPPISWTKIRCFLQMPARYLHTRGCDSLAMSFRRCLVLSVMHVAMGHVPRLQRCDCIRKLPTALLRGAVGYPVGAPKALEVVLGQTRLLNPPA